jgi:23S rRNA pseudouridine1911/1915/1917 synthase
MSEEVYWTVPPEIRAIRLDAFVRRCLPHLSQREAQKAIEEGAFWIADRRGRKGDRLSAGQRVSFRGEPHWLASAPLPRADLDLMIRYEDESIIVVDKPAGIPTHGFSGRETRSLANFLAAVRPDLCGVGRSPWEPGLINRLDRGTSGLVLAAKQPAAFAALRAQSQRGAIKKKYWALVWGVTEEQGTIALPLAHDRKDRRKMATETQAGTRGSSRRWPAITHFRRRLSAQGFSLIEVAIERGVTHQIRAHLLAASHPIVGDPLYSGGREDRFALGRQFLHAYRMEFTHPSDGRSIAVESSLPDDLRRVLTELGMPA